MIHQILDKNDVNQYIIYPLQISIKYQIVDIITN